MEKLFFTPFLILEIRLLCMIKTQYCGYTRVAFNIIRIFIYYDRSKIKKHFGIEPKQFYNIHQQMDTGGPYNSFDEMYIKFNKEVETNPKIKISKIK